MTTRMLILAAAAGLAAVLGCGTNGDHDASETSNHRGTQDRNNPDAMFLSTAAQANLGEVDAGRLAEQKASDSDVRKFGQHMVEDHTAANGELVSLARRKGITVPSETDSEHKKIASKLANLSGAEFDRKYMEAMVNGHQKVVALFEANSKSARDADIRAFAEGQLPTLRKHLKMARDIYSRLGASTTPN